MHAISIRRSVLLVFALALMSVVPAAAQPVPDEGKAAIEFFSRSVGMKRYF
jgi:hypothetical protein